MKLKLFDIMTQEEKQLLVQDLCGRLLYGVKVNTWYNKPMNVKCVGVDVYTNTVNLDIPNDDDDDDDAKVYIENVQLKLNNYGTI